MLPRIRTTGTQVNWNKKQQKNKATVGGYPQFSLPGQIQKGYTTRGIPFFGFLYLFLPLNRV